MALNLGNSGGDYDPYVKYNAKAGRWYVKGDDGEQEVQNPVFVADFDNIKTGWIFYAEGQAPSQTWDENLTTPAPRPSDRHKRGFSLRLFSKASFGGVVDLSSTSMHLCSAINDLYTQYESARGSNAGMLPVVKYTGSTPMKDKLGTNYKPNFVIEKWVARPAELSAVKAAPIQAQAQPAQSGVSEF